MSIILLCLGSSSEARMKQRMEQIMRKYYDLKKNHSDREITFVLTGLKNETKYMKNFLESKKPELKCLVEIVYSMDTQSNLSNTAYIWKYGEVYFATGNSHAKRVERCVEELGYENVLFKHIPSNEKEVWYEKLANYLYCFPFGRKVLGWIAAQFRN